MKNKGNLTMDVKTKIFLQENISKQTHCCTKLHNSRMETIFCKNDRLIIKHSAQNMFTFKCYTTSIALIKCNLSTLFAFLS